MITKPTILTELVWRIKRPFRLFFNGMQNLFVWLPTIWTDRQWDYAYLIKIQIKKLEIMHKYYSNPKNVYMCEESRKRIVSRIDTAKRLMNDIYLESKYVHEYSVQFKELYGNSECKFVPSKTKPGQEDFITVYEKQYTSLEIERIEEHKDQLREKSLNKDEKAKRILWQFISHNIEYWWD